jgi:hypothetical protein
LKNIILLFAFVTSSFCSTKLINDYASSVGKYLIVSKTIVIGSGDTLKVPQGREVLFTNLSGMTISSGGTLSAIGTKDQPIYFTSLLDTSNSASAFDWNGIDIKKGASAHFAYCLIAFSTTGLTSEDSTGVQLESCIFSVNGQWNFSMSGIITQVPDGKPFSFLPQAPKQQIITITPVQKDTIFPKVTAVKPSLNRTRNLVLGGVGVVLAAAGAASFYKSNSYRSEYNAYVPGNASFDAANPSTRQIHFNSLRNKYNTLSTFGWTCAGLAAVDVVFLIITIKF